MNKEEKKREKRIKKKIAKGEALLCSSMHFDAKEAYKLLRTNVIFTIPDKRCRKIGVTSSFRGEGKSTCSINLAYTLSATNNKVLLIDMDLRLPTIANKLDVSSDLGLADYLVGKASAEQIIYKVGKYQNWDVIFSGTIPPTPAELIGSENMKNFVARLEANYDYIIMDLPPVNVVSDALVAKDLVDGFIVVVRENYTDKRQLSDCIRQLDFLDSKILGFCLVDSTNSSTSYSRRYKGKYYRKHGYYGSGYGYYQNNSVNRGNNG